MAYNERFHRDLRKELEDRRARGKEDDFWTGLKGAIESQQISPHEFSIRGLFENFVETRANGQRVGPELVNSFNPSRGGGRTLLEEAGNAISTANFSNITGQIMYSTLLDRYKDRSFIGEKLVTTVPTEFNGEKIPGINRIGDEAESIGEGKAYPTASFSESWIQTPQTTKRGMIVQVTLETVFFDRTGLVLENAGEVGYWMGVNKEKRILDHILGLTNSYNFLGTAYNTYQSSSPWINVQAANQLIDFVSINTALLLFDKMTDPFTGEPIAVMADTMLVPSALHPTAMALQRATEVWAAPGLTTDTPTTAGGTWSTHAPNPAQPVAVRRQDPGEPVRSAVESAGLRPRLECHELVHRRLQTGLYVHGELAHPSHPSPAGQRGRIHRRRGGPLQGHRTRHRRRPRPALRREMHRLIGGLCGLAA